MKFWKALNGAGFCCREIKFLVRGLSIRLDGPIEGKCLKGAGDNCEASQGGCVLRRGNVKDWWALWGLNGTVEHCWGQCVGTGGSAASWGYSEKLVGTEGSVGSLRTL